jgi:hypothetical protein
MRYAILVYIALGLVLSLVFCIEYNCDGQDMFPTYYGSPFVFKQKSLGSSMEYFYSISGLLLNLFVWSFLLFMIDLLIQSIMVKFDKSKLISRTYKVVVSLMIALSSLFIAMDVIMLGRGFDEDLNYWYWDVDKKVKEWGVNCKGEVMGLSLSR